METETLEIDGIIIRAEAVELIRKGYATVTGALADARIRGVARPITRLSELIRGTSVTHIPPLLTDQQRRRFEELTGAYLAEHTLPLMWAILENDLGEHGLWPAYILARPEAALVADGSHPGVEVRLIPKW